MFLIVQLRSIALEIKIETQLGDFSLPFTVYRCFNLENYSNCYRQKCIVEINVKVLIYFRTLCDDPSLDGFTHQRLTANSWHFTRRLALSDSLTGVSLSCTLCKIVA